MTSTTGVHLRPWRAGDLDDIARIRNDLGLRRLLMADARRQSSGEVLAWLEQRSRQEDFELLVIALREDDGVVGYVQAAAIDRRNGVADLGICLAAAAQGRGYGRQACELFHAHLREAFGLRKLLLRVLSDNVRAISLYRRLGYREVGTLSRHHLEAGSYHDVLIMEAFLQPW